MKKLTKAQRHRYVRVCYDLKDKPVKIEFVETPPRLAKEMTAFDELVLGAFFHIERLSDETWWVRIGDRGIVFHASPAGPVRIVEDYVIEEPESAGGTD